MRAQRVCPGERVLIGGTGPLNLQLACELVACGVKPVAVVEASPRPGAAAWRELWRMARHAPDLVRDGMAMLGTLKRAGVRVLWSARVTEVVGEADASGILPLPLREGGWGEGLADADPRPTPPPNPLPQGEGEFSPSPLTAHHRRSSGRSDAPR